MGIIATDPSGLADTTTYYFKVNGVEYDITTGSSPTYEDVADLIDTALNGAGFGAKIVPASGGEGAEDIRVYNDTVRGSGSTCLLAHGDTSPDLFANLNFWPEFRKPPVYALEPASQSFTIERSMSGEISLAGEADVVEPYLPTEGEAFYGDTYYQDEYYGDKG